jgi:hypothetical protein
MDVVANYTVGEEAVGAFFSCEGRKGKPPSMMMRAPVEGPRRTRRIKHGRSSRKTSTTISSPPWNAEGLEALQRGASSIRC